MASYQGRPPIRRRPIRPRRAALVLALAGALSACGTWDPTNDADPEADRTTPVEEATGDDTTGGAAELTVGDGGFEFSITDCTVSDGGVRFAGRSPDGDSISGEFEADAPEDASIVVVDQDGNQLYTSDESSGVPAPEFQMTEDGFAATGTFVADDDSQVQGDLSGAC